MKPLSTGDSLVLGNRERSPVVRDRVLDLVRFYVEVAAAVRATATCRLRVKKSPFKPNHTFTHSTALGAALFGSISDRELQSLVCQLNCD
jgi:hypothetical protein